MLKTSDILDEKEKILHEKSEEVTFPLTEEDKKTIKDIIEIKLENNKNPIENRNDKNFSYYYNLIWKEIDHE